MQARVDYILKYDDALTRTYKSSTGLTLSLYVAYWNAGKVPVHEAGLHNPDTCWVVSGWKRGERKNNCEQSIDGQALKTFEYGAYIKDKHTEYVIFWHLVGDSVNRIDIVGHRNGLEGKIERFILALKSMKKLGFNQRREQLFIRLSSPVPYEELWNRPDFHEFLEHMAPLRIFAANIPADNTPVSE